MVPRKVLPLLVVCLSGAAVLMGVPPAAAAPLTTGPSAGGPTPGPRLVLQGHRFEPLEVHAPAGQTVVIEVENRDDAVEEFESYDLDREQRVRPGETGRIPVGPLARGRYEFFGDFHRKTARGVLVID